MNPSITHTHYNNANHMHEDNNVNLRPLLFPHIYVSDVCLNELVEGSKQRAQVNLW